MTSTDAIGDNVELTFKHGDTSYIFSAKWRYLSGSLGMPGYYTLDNTWTYYVTNPTEQLLTTIRSLPNVAKVNTEEVPGTGSTALDILVSFSREFSLEDCLVAVTDALTA